MRAATSSRTFAAHRVRLGPPGPTQDGWRARCGPRSKHSCDVGGACTACRLLPFQSGAMSFTEINVFGVYVAPISLMMVAAWLVLIALRRVADHFGLLRHVWHPALFVFAIYMTVLSSMVLIVAR